MKVDLGPEQLIPLVPAAALVDFREYLHQGGRFALDVWWERYKDDYVRREAQP